jgi:hypothetical protein
MEQAASGQSCVLYRGSLCLGGGILSWLRVSIEFFVIRVV